LAGGGAWEGGSTTSVWGGVEAGPEGQAGFVESGRLESLGGGKFDPSCGAPSGVAIPRKYNPATAKARQVDASMRLTRVIPPFDRAGLTISYQLELDLCPSPEGNLECGSLLSLWLEPACWQGIIPSAEIPPSKLAGRKAAASCRAPKADD
jgi:hypothetical protein